MLHIVAVNGSERPRGNTSLVLAHAADVVTELGGSLEVVNLRELQITPCGPCGDCNDRVVPCDLRDDTTHAINRMRVADGVIYAAPVHGYGMSSLMQAFIERAGVGHLRFQRPLTNKVAGAIVTGRRYGHTEVHAQLVHNILLNRMILVGSGHPATVHAGSRGEALLDREGLESVSRLVSRMVSLMALLAAHRTLTGRGLSVPHTTERAVR